MLGPKRQAAGPVLIALGMGLVVAVSSNKLGYARHLQVAPTAPSIVIG